MARTSPNAIRRRLRRRSRDGSNYKHPPQLLLILLGYFGAAYASSGWGGVGFLLPLLHRVGVLGLM